LLGNIIAEATAAGATKREYIWLPEAEIAPTMGSRAQVDRPVAVVEGVNTLTPQLWNVAVDHLHRPIRMADATKTLMWEALWTPWGAPHTLSGPAMQDARFPGQWFQLESGVHYNWHRHYDPTIGRYTQPDPLGFVDGPSVYAYATGSPAMRVDRDGRQVAEGARIGGAFGPGGAVIGAAGGAALYCLLNPQKCRDLATRIVNLCKPLYLEEPADDAERCRIAHRRCRMKCIDYAMSHPVGGIGGADRPSHYRRCMRECMEDANCPYND